MRDIKSKTGLYVGFVLFFLAQLACAPWLVLPEAPVIALSLVSLGAITWSRTVTLNATCIGAVAALFMEAGLVAGVFLTWDASWSLTLLAVCIGWGVTSFATAAGLARMARGVVV